MRIRVEVVPFLIAAAVTGAFVSGICKASKLSWNVSIIPGLIIFIVFTGYFLYFFRNPERHSPDDPTLVLSGADGVIAKIVEMDEPNILKTRVVRISIFLSLFNVHVNRAPISGKSKFLGYFPGKHLFTFNEKSSDVNQHNKIYMENEKTKCLITQIVGPVCRRVVYWPDHEKTVELKAGAPIGMMKFGSRMDLYFPKDDIDVVAKLGDKVVAGETVIARIKKGL